MSSSKGGWGDEDEDVLPARQVLGPDEKGIKTVIEYKFNEKRQQVKVTTRFRVCTVHTRRAKAIAARRKLAKFGLSEGQEQGVVDPAFTQTEKAEIKIDNPAAEAQDNTQELLDQIAAGTFQVTSKWRGGEGEAPPAEGDGAGAASGTPGAWKAGGLRGGALSATGGKYVPPSMRGGGRGMSMDDNRDTATLRVTNISEDTSEQDLRELFSRFGHIQRIYLAKDKETFRSRGFAFITFHSRKEAAKAMEMLQGYGYDHLILKIEWAKPSTRDAGSESVMKHATGYGRKLAQDTTEKVSYSSSAKHNRT